MDIRTTGTEYRAITSKITTTSTYANTVAIKTLTIIAISLCQPFDSLFRLSRSNSLSWMLTLNFDHGFLFIKLSVRNLHFQSSHELTIAQLFFALIILWTKKSPDVFGAKGALELLVVFSILRRKIVVSNCAN